MWIEALRIEGGVLDGFTHSFSANLNVLIGGRGTGKSSVIELIRFGLGATSYTKAGEQHATEHALGVLGDGRVTLTLRNGADRIEISRTAQDPDAEKWDDEVRPLVFSQSEIETLGLEAQSRLRLIDAFVPMQSGPSESPITARIRSATAEIRTQLAEIDDIAEKTAELPKLEAQLATLKAQGAAQTTVHSEIEGYRRSLTEITPLLAASRVRSETIGRIANRLNEWVLNLEALLEEKPSIEPWPAEAATLDELADLRRRETQAVRRLRADLEELLSITRELGKKQEASTSQRIGLENRARDIRQQIEERQKGASALDKRISDLTQQISVLKSLVDLKRQREERVTQISAQRAKLIDQQDDIRQQHTKAREKIASDLNKKLGPFVRVRIDPYSQYRPYVTGLAAALRGSGLRYTELAERISETYSPQEIAALAEARDLRALASSLGITEERALRLCDALRNNAGNLFTIAVEDDVRIELLDGSDYKGIDSLSMGQRCTVILPIVLQHTERAIILDQPEDHLDNAFVVGTLVKGLVARSNSAQTIVATHNANIPVLGDADQVIHLDSDGSRCFIRCSGSLTSPPIVDAITTIMEGGRDAFARRAEFYRKNLT